MKLIARMMMTQMEKLLALAGIFLSAPMKVHPRLMVTVILHLIPITITASIRQARLIMLLYCNLLLWETMENL